MDIIALMDALKIEKAVLGGFDWGARTADIIAALWPERVKALVSVSGYLIGSREADKMPLPPKAELAWWYQFYFATERGRAGYEANRHDFNKLIWQIASPKWDFDDATFDRTAAVVRQSGPRGDRDPQLPLAAGPGRRRSALRRPGSAAGQRPGHHGAHDHHRRRCQRCPARRTRPSYAGKFVGKYEHRTFTGGIGHNLPQEAPAGVRPGHHRRRSILIGTSPRSARRIAWRRPPGTDLPRRACRLAPCQRVLSKRNLSERPKARLEGETWPGHRRPVHQR